MPEELGSVHWFMNTYLILLSQIDDSYNSVEVFPSGYCIFRKDRCEGAGGVFICIKETLSASAIPSLDTDAEIVWAKIDVPKGNPIFICSYTTIASPPAFEGLHDDIKLFVVRRLCRKLLKKLQ